MKKSYSALRLILFILGIIVLAFAFLMLGPLFENNRAQYVFACVSVSLMYLTFFLPVLLGSFKGGVAAIAASAAVYFKGLIIYSVISIADIALTFTVLPLGAAIAIQAVALFVLIIWLFMAFVSKDQIESSLHDEEIKKAPVMELRNKARRLSALAAGLDKGDSVRARAEKIADNMQYLSPGNTKNEHDIEYRMLAVLDSIITDSYFVSEGGRSAASLESKFKDFDALYRERKNMR